MSRWMALQRSNDEETGRTNDEKHGSMSHREMELATTMIWCAMNNIRCRCGRCMTRRHQLKKQHRIVCGRNRLNRKQNGSWWSPSWPARRASSWATYKPHIVPDPWPLAPRADAFASKAVTIGRQSALRAMERHERDRRHSVSHTWETTLTHT